MRLDAAIRDAAERLGATSESPRLDAEILLCRTIDMPRSYLFAHPEDTLDDLTRDRFEALVGRRESGVPMAYITGIKEFWSRDFVVSPATLVPRPETELLISLAMHEIPREEGWQVLDLGTGSGAIAVTIACERPLSQVTGVDISEDALAVARENARAHAPGNVEFVHGSWVTPVRDRTFDIVISNPPYVAEGDSALQDLQYEPAAALEAGPEGLDAIGVLATDCRDVLAERGLLLLEHGAEQGDRVAALLEAAGWTDIQGHDDLAGLPRVTAARRGGT